MENSLVSQDVLNEILRTTGAVKDAKIEHVITGDFKRYDFKPKVRDEFDLGIFEDGFDQLVKSLNNEFTRNYFEECEFQRNPASLVDLNKSDFREKAFCLQFKSALFEECFLIYLAQDAFYSLLNEYLGGGKVESQKAEVKLTAIEENFLKKVATGLGTILSASFESVEPFGLELINPNLPLSEQKSQLVDRSLVAEYFYEYKESELKILMSLPMAYLNLIQEKLSGGDSSEGSDPLWEQTVTDAFFQMGLDMKISVGSFSIPFKKSVNLSVGDVFFWEKDTNDVMVCQGDQPRIVGTLGVINEKFAVRVNEVIER